jgi:hypothetical protein
MTAMARGSRRGRRRRGGAGRRRRAASKTWQRWFRAQGTRRDDKVWTFTVYRKGPDRVRIITPDAAPRSIPHEFTSPLRERDVRREILVVYHVGGLKVLPEPVLDSAAPAPAPSEPFTLADDSE